MPVTCPTYPRRRTRAPTEEEGGVLATAGAPSRGPYRRQRARREDLTLPPDRAALATSTASGRTPGPGQEAEPARTSAGAGPGAASKDGTAASPVAGAEGVTSREAAAAIATYPYVIRTTEDHRNPVVLYRVQCRIARSGVRWSEKRDRYVKRALKEAPDRVAALLAEVG